MEAAGRPAGSLADFTHHLATAGDLPMLADLAEAAIETLQRPFLSPAQLAASRGVMGIDTQLIADGTYFVVLSGAALAGCGGWSRRATLFGGDHSPGRNAALLDPSRDAARVRAMYTAPAFARRGVGRLILSLCEAAARAEGFGRAELAATLAGVPLYERCGYALIEAFEAVHGGVAVPLRRMGKVLGQ